MRALAGKLILSALISRRTGLALAAALLAPRALRAAEKPGIEPSIEIVDPWLRPPLAKGVPAVAYVTLIDRSGAGDTLVGIATGGDGMADLHETVTSGGITQMRPLASLTIPPGGRAELKPGSAHIMITGLTHAPKIGDTFPLELRFKAAAPLTVNFAVRMQ